MWEKFTNTEIPAVGTIAINSEEFKLLRDLVYERFGINLTKTKRALVVSRLQNVLQLQGFANFKSYYQYLITDRTNQGLNELINQISTNFSYFYRENAHFDFFSRQALPQLIEKLRCRDSRDIRLWTAGCSTGEEPYMLIMLMMEHLGLDYGNWNAGLLATDISERVLKMAAEAVYPLDRIERVPAHIRQRYFKAAGSGLAVVSSKVKKDITLRRFNLMNPFPFKKPFQMIFCRNVMIYFDKPTRDKLIARFHQFLEPGGYLFIGHSESLGRVQKLYKYIMPACYQKLDN